MKKLPVNETKFLIEPILIKDGVSILGGQPKAGKTALALEAAYSICRGEDFLGAFPTLKGRVFLLLLEENHDQVLEKLIARGFQDEDNILIQTGLHQPITFNDIKEAVTAENPDFIVVDHFVLGFNPKDLNDYVEVTKILTPLRELARSYNTHICILHHQGKSHSGSASILGSTAITGAFDSILLLNRDGESNRTLRTIQRYGTDVPPSRLTMDPTNLSLSIEDYEPPEVPCDRIRRQMIEYVTLNDGCTKEEIFTHVKGKKKTKLLILEGLLHSREIATSGKGVKGDPLTYSVADSGSQTVSPMPGNQEPKFSDILMASKKPLEQELT